MDMHEAAHQAHLWLDWGQFAGLPEPKYITLAVHGDRANVGYQFDATKDVVAWAQSLALTPQRSDYQGQRITRATLATDRCELECYVVHPLPAVITSPSYAVTPCAP